MRRRSTGGASFQTRFLSSLFPPFVSLDVYVVAVIAVVAVVVVVHHLLLLLLHVVVVVPPLLRARRDSPLFCPPFARLSARVVPVLPPRDDSREAGRAERCTGCPKGRPAGENSTDRRMTARAQVGQVPERSESEGEGGEWSRERKVDASLSLSPPRSGFVADDPSHTVPGNSRLSRTLYRPSLSLPVPRIKRDET